MKKIDIRIYIIIILAIILSVMIYFYFKDDGSTSFDFNNFDRNSSSSATDSSDTVVVSASTQVNSALNENIRLHATYYFKKILVGKNELVKKGTKIIEYTNGKYLTAPYDLVITNYNLPDKKGMCNTSHYISVSSYNVLSASFRVSEEKISSIALGDTAKVKITALNDKELTGYVTNISSTASNGYFTVTVEFDNDGDVRIGMSVNVTV